MGSILKLFGIGSGTAEQGEASQDTETVRRIVGELDQLEPDRARYLAAFAFLLSRVARADLEICDDESREMERVVAKHGGLPEAQAVLVVQIAKTQSGLLGGTENFTVAKQFAELASDDDKLGLVRCLFEIAAANDSISTVETNVIRQIVDELRLEHRAYAAIRSEFRDRLNVLRRPDDPD